MAKLIGPLLSLAARGSLGAELTFSGRKSCAQVRFQKKQPDYENDARKIIRDAFRYGLILWNALPPVEQAYWTEMERFGFVYV